jgi:hypothetical protein
MKARCDYTALKGRHAIFDYEDEGDYRWPMMRGQT